MTQKELMQIAINKAGNQYILAELIGNQQANISAWLHEKKKISLVSFLNICEKLEIKMLNL